MEDTSPQPYWASRPGIAAIKAEHVRWDLIHPKNRPAEVTLDVESADSAAENGELPPPPELDDDDAAEGSRPSNGGVSDLTRSTEEPPRKRQKASGQNKGRQFARVQEEVKLCNSTARGEACARQKQGLECSNSHDLKAYLDENKEEDIEIERPDADGRQKLTCPSFGQLGACPFGFRCRFLSSHVTHHGDPNEGFQATGLSLVYNFDKIRSIAPSTIATEEDLLNWIYDTKGEYNVVGPEGLLTIRKQKTEDLPITKAYLTSIGEALDTRAAPGGKGGRGGRGGKGRARGGRQKDGGWGGRDGGKQAATEDPAENPTSNGAGFDEPRASIEDSQSKPDNGDDSARIGEEQKYTPDVPLKPSEKKRLHFENKLYLAPLTTVGNLPFRRLCVQYGADITCGEMGLAQEYMVANRSEWSLIRRHPSEKIFGIQLCGNRPQTLVSATEMIKSQCDNVDFIDVNLGCPIDLVVKKGAGSALLDHGARLGKILQGMNLAAGDTPVTIKMRTGIKTGSNTTHKMMPKAVKEWGVGAVTVHGRTQQQRYSKSADYDYIKTCVDTLRSTAEDMDIAPIPIFGNGDAYDHRTYWQNVEETGVDGVMIARGALIKPWLFTEIKERRDWDISSRERLDMIGDLAKFGLEHWGSDTQGVNTTRRFLCEALSFTYRYVPVGLLERLPAKMNDRPYAYRGRDDLETLLASDNASDWVKISNMFLGPPPESWSFMPKHKSNAYGTEESNG